jgi:hypothetical protein
VQIAKAQISATPDERGVTTKCMKLASAAKSRFDMFLLLQHRSRSHERQKGKLMFVFTLTEVIGVAIFTITCACLFIDWALRKYKQARCPHESFYETMACDAVCNSCGKNLGFIGTVYKKRAAIAEQEQT